MSEDATFWGFARTRVQWQRDGLTGRNRPLPHYYLAEERGYKHPPSQTLHQLETQMSEIASWWNNIPGWWFSGAPSLSLQTTYDRPHTNIDIGVIRNPANLEKMAEEAEKRKRFWFERKISWKLLPGSETKKEILEPIDVHQLVYDIRENRNPVLLEIEGNEIIIGNLPIQHIFIHMYEERNGNYYCLEDGLQFPKSTMVTTSYRTHQGVSLRLIKPAHILHKKRAMIEEGNKNPKHLADIAKGEKHPGHA